MPNDTHVHERLAKLELPAEITQDNLKLAARDAEILAERLKDQPAKMLELLTAARANDADQVQSLLTELKLRHSDVQAEGGGFFWIIVVIVLLYATDAY